MAKQVSAYIKLQVPAGKANPSPPVGPALGQHGPLSIDAAFFNITLAGGVFLMKVKLRSSYTVITTGMGSPGS